MSLVSNRSFGVKLKFDGSLDCYEARWAVCGGNQQPSVDYNETFYPIVKTIIDRNASAWLCGVHGLLISRMSRIKSCMVNSMRLFIDNNRLVLWTLLD